jgi:ATP-binding cassette, subfamily B, bacterial
MSAPPTRSSASIWDLVARFLPFSLQVWPLAALATGLVLLSPLVAVSLLWLMKLLIDDVFIGGHVEFLAIFAAIYLALVAVKAGLSYALSRLEAGINERIVQNIRSSLYHHLISVSPGSLDKHSVGDLLTHLSGDVERTEYLVYSGLLGIISNAVTALFFACFLLVLSWKLTLCALLAAPVLTLLSLRLSPRVRRASKIARHKATAWMSLAEERLGAAPLLHAFDTQARETGTFQSRCGDARHAELRTVAIQAWLTLLIELAAALVGLLVLVVGAYETQSGNLTVGALVAFLGSVGSLYSPIRSLANASGRFQRAAAGAQRVLDLLDTPSLVVERPAAAPLLRVRGALEFRDVRFAYGRGPEVLRGVSFRADPGEAVAVVGPNGSGKSTLIRLALRLCDPSAGAVLVDGMDLRDVTLASLRQATAAVFQESYVLRGSLADNLRYGRPDAAEDEFLHAARTARVDTFADGLRSGYRAPVGPRGAWLSGGQRQRLAFARALLRDAPILLLDEAMTSVDSESEELIQEAVERLAGQRTILLVAHRLSSVRRADRVIVLDGGKIMEIGTPDTLLRAGSRYRALFAAQLLPGNKDGRGDAALGGRDQIELAADGSWHH